MEFYHDFSALGLNLPQKKGIFAPNQTAKAPVISGYLLFAIGKLRANDMVPLTVAELFCADAYYSFLARRFGADRCYAFDSNRDGILPEARYVRSLLKDDAVEIVETEVANISPDFRASIVINAGGLYHVEEPLRYLEQSYKMAEQYLIVQSAITIATEDENYFETPAPGWSWGCRFTYGYLEKEIRKRGYKVVDSERNLLRGNDRPEDRGSAYFLIEK
jgi:hypothetical protein